MIIAYRLNEDARRTNKDQFYDGLQKELDQLEDNEMLVRDLNE